MVAYMAPVFAVDCGPFADLDTNPLSIDPVDGEMDDSFLDSELINVPSEIADLGTVD